MLGLALLWVFDLNLYTLQALQLSLGATLGEVKRRRESNARVELVLAAFVGSVVVAAVSAAASSNLAE